MGGVSSPQAPLAKKGEPLITCKVETIAYFRGEKHVLAQWAEYSGKKIILNCFNEESKVENTAEHRIYKLFGFKIN